VILAAWTALSMTGVAFGAPARERAQPPKDERPTPPADLPDPAGVAREPAPLTAAPAGAADAMPAAPSMRPADARRSDAPPQGSPQASGEGPRAAPPHPDATDADDPKTAPVPLARDTVGGHIAVGAIAGVIVPLGSTASGTAQSDVLSPGLVLAGDITYGVSRTVMLGAYGDFGMPSGSGPWAGQNASSISVGPLLRYHLVQGVRFDPWLSAGIGFRRTSGGKDALTGIDWTRLQIGGDWYATSQLGFGPVLELALGTFLDSSASNLGAKSVNAHFVLGGRVVFDGPGK
jgi:hypothetical protein